MPKSIKNPDQNRGILGLLKRVKAKSAKLIVAIILAVVGSLARLIPFVFVYLAFREVIAHLRDLSLIAGDYLIALGVGALSAAVVSGVALYFSALLAHSSAFEIIFDVRMQLMKKLQRIPLGLFSSIRQGEMKSILSDDVEQIESFIAHHICDAASALAVVLFSFIGLGLIDWRLMLALLIPVVGAFVALAKALGSPKGRYEQEAVRGAKEKMNGTVVEYVHGMPVVKVFSRSLKSFQHFERDAQACLDTIKSATTFTAPSIGGVYAFLGTQLLWLLLALLLILPSVLANPSTYPWFVSEILLFFLIGSAMKESITQMFIQLVGLSSIEVALARIDTILDYPDLPIIQTPQAPQDNSLAFKKVSFSYDEKDISPALNEVSFTLSPGTITALVGSSGAGKSTIASLALRFFDPLSGQVSFGGVDLRHVSPDSLCKYILPVFQDSFMLNDTIEANIRMGNRKATAEEVSAAICAVQLDALVDSLPQGLHTLIGLEGVQLSGGEAQRLAIARLFLQEAPVLILDEPTSYADAETEMSIQQALARLAKGKSVLIIAHRLKTIERADAILVMKSGQLIARGSHDELMESCAVYQAMVAADERGSSWELR